MDHSENKFRTAEELTEHLGRYVINIEERARLVIDYGTVDQKICALRDILDELRKPWRHRANETNWRSELILANKDFCVEHGLLDKPKLKPKKASKTS